MEKIITSAILVLILFFASRFLKNLKKGKKLKIPNLHFKDNESAFEYASKYFSATLLTTNQMNIGIIKSIEKDFDGLQFIIQLADSTDVVLVSGFNNKYASEISIGNLIYWGFTDNASNNLLGIKAVGHVLAILSPELNLHTNKWTIKKDLTK